MNKKNVSIYIPAFNAEKTIRDSITSIKNQSYQFDEIIVINDNSNDWQATPLIYAIYGNGDLEMVRMLISVGADKEKVDRDSKTALDRAKRRRKMDIVNYLENM